MVSELQKWSHLWCFGSFPDLPAFDLVFSSGEEVN